jgi:hypothetical protein
MYIVRWQCFINVLIVAVVKGKLMSWQPREWKYLSCATWQNHCIWTPCHCFLQSGLINLSKNNNLLGVITSRKRRDASKLYSMSEVPDGPLPFPTKVGS